MEHRSAHVALARAHTEHLLTLVPANYRDRVFGCDHCGVLNPQDWCMNNCEMRNIPWCALAASMSPIDPLMQWHRSIFACPARGCPGTCACVGATWHNRGGGGVGAAHGSGRCRPSGRPSMLLHTGRGHGVRPAFVPASSDETNFPPPLPSSLRVHARPTHLLDETNVIAVHLSKQAVNGRRTH